MLRSRQFQDAVLSHVMEGLLHYFSLNAYNIAFPELAMPIVIRLRKHHKLSKAGEACGISIRDRHAEPPGARAGETAD